MPDSLRPLRRDTRLEVPQSLWSEYEIDTTTSLTDRVLRTLKHGDAFGSHIDRRVDALSQLV